MFLSEETLTPNIKQSTIFLIEQTYSNIHNETVSASALYEVSTLLHPAEHGAARRGKAMEGCEVWLDGQADGAWEQEEDDENEEDRDPYEGEYLKCVRGCVWCVVTSVVP